MDKAFFQLPVGRCPLRGGNQFRCPAFADAEVEPSDSLEGLGRDVIGYRIHRTVPWSFWLLFELGPRWLWFGCCNSRLRISALQITRTKILHKGVPRSRVVGALAELCGEVEPRRLRQPLGQSWTEAEKPLLATRRLRSGRRRSCTVPQHCSQHRRRYGWGIR